MPSAEDIKRWFAIDANRGVVTWRESPRRGMRGKPAGFVSTSNGVRKHKVKVHGFVIRRENLVFFAANGRWPYPYVQHLNGDTLDDRIENLKEVPGRPPRFRRRRIDLPMGVREMEGKFQARLRYRKRLLHLGVYPTPEAAHGVYMQKRREIYGS